MPSPAQTAAALVAWFDTDRAAAHLSTSRSLNLVRCIPFIACHLACLGVFAVGVSPTAVWVAVALYAVRMFAVTGFYHRYFSHRSFKTGRVAQFVFALIGCTAVQRGPLWWAAHHRIHHRHADGPDDPHAPRHGFWRSHMTWFTCDAAFATDYDRIKDFARYRELRLLNRFDMVVPLLFAAAIYGAGVLLARFAPELGTNGPQLLVWGFFISTAAVWHVTFCVNSLAHVWGTRRFATPDNSRNNILLALLTLGEGWHNNHHRYPGAARQGFKWWEIDMTWYLLNILAAVGIVWDLRPVPASVHREVSAESDALTGYTP